MTPASPRFVLITPSGHGNLGDAAIQDAVIAQLRRRYVSPEIVAATLHPADTERRHGVRAVPLIAMSRPGYTLYPVEQDAPSGRTTDAPGTRPWRARAHVLMAAAARALLPTGWPGLLRAEATHALTAFRLLRGARALIVSGGGQVDEFWGGPWGHPWTLLKWAALARLRGARVLVLSTGFGTLDTRWGRRLVRRALALAHYRSYRDLGSKALMREAGFAADDPVVPDLAYATPLPDVRPAPKRAAGPLTIGVSPIVYCDPRSWPHADAAVFERYGARLEEVIDWLRHQGHRVVLLSSNASDGRLAQELFARLRAHAAPGGLELAETGEVNAFLCAAAGVDLIVASRLHGVLLAHVMGTTVIALSHDRKVDAHMQELGREALRLEIERFDLAQFQRVFTDAVALRRDTGERVAELRRRVVAQFDAVLPA